MYKNICFHQYGNKIFYGKIQLPQTALIFKWLFSFQWDLTKLEILMSDDWLQRFACLGDGSKTDCFRSKSQNFIVFRRVETSESFVCSRALGSFPVWNWVCYHWAYGCWSCIACFGISMMHLRFATCFAASIAKAYR